MSRNSPSEDAVIAAESARNSARDELVELRRRRGEVDAEILAADEGLKAAGLRMARAPGNVADEAYEAAGALLNRLRVKASGLVESVIPDAETALEEAEEVLAEALRADLAQQAQAAVDAAAALLESRYEVLRAEFMTLKDAVTEANRLAGRANSQLPEGRTPIMPVEALVRDFGGTGRRIVSEEAGTIYVFEGTLDPVPEDRLGEVIPTSEGRFKLPGRSLAISTGRTVERRRVKRVIYEVAAPRRHGHRIADLELPPLKASGPPPQEAFELIAADGAEAADSRD